MMEPIYGPGGVWVFLLMTVVIFGGAAFLTGQVVSVTWRPVGQVVGYVLLLTCADRFLVYGLFEGDLTSLTGFAIDAVVLEAIALLAYRLTRARKMVSQYPWLYQSAGPLAWRRRGDEEA